MSAEENLALKKQQLPDQNSNWIPDSYEKGERSSQFHLADTLGNLPEKELMDKRIQNLPEGSLQSRRTPQTEDDQTSNAGSSLHSNPPQRKSAGKDPMYYSVGSTPQNQSNRAGSSNAKSRTRSSSRANNKHLHPIEVQGKRVSLGADSNTCDSPYACKIFEIPAEQDISTKRVIVSDKDNKHFHAQLIVPVLQTVQASTSTEAMVRWLSSQQSLEDGNVSVSDFIVGPMPLLSWPTSSDLKAASNSPEGHTNAPVPIPEEIKADPVSVEPSKPSVIQKKPAHNKAKSIVKKNKQFLKQTKPIDPEQKVVQDDNKSWISTASTIGVQASDETGEGPLRSLARCHYTDSFTEPEDNLALAESTEQRLIYLGGLAKKLEQSVFSSYEASSVIIQTVFKESLGDPRSLEAVLESPQFQAFLHAPNEVQALRTLSSLFIQSSRVIGDYLDSMGNTGVSFPSKTEFSIKSNQALLAAAKSSSNCRSNQVAAATVALNKAKKELQSSFVYSFLPRPLLSSLPNSGSYSLTLFRNPENGDIIQTVQCGNSVYRTTFSTSPLQCDRIRSLMSASTEHFGLPELPLPERLVDTFVRSASFASSSLTAAKTSFLKCCRDIYRTSTSFQDSKYTIASVKGRRSHSALLRRLRELNLYAGMIYQVSFDLFNACEAMQVGIRKSLEVQECLKFPRIPNYPNPRLNKECQLPAVVAGGRPEGGPPGPSTSTSTLGTSRIPMQYAMVRLSEGIKGLAHTTRMGYFCLESERSGGIQLTKPHRKVLKEFVVGLKAMGSHKEVEFGSLLMGILCSSELIGKKFSPEQEKVNGNVEGIDSFHRAAIVNHLGKINWAMLEIVSSVKRMKNDAYILTLHTTKRLKEARMKRFYY